MGKGVKSEILKIQFSRGRFNLRAAGLVRGLSATKSGAFTSVSSIKLQFFDLYRLLEENENSVVEKPLVFSQ